MIGEIRWILTPFYDIAQSRNSFKKRPALIFAQSDSGDYNILPLSRVTRKENIHPVFDKKIDPAVYPKTNLTAVSYVRTHKQTVANIAEISGLVCDLRKEYPDLYLEILSLLESYNAFAASQSL